MATKIGFDAKLAGTGVDWATVGKDVSETLILQEQARELNRVSMDKAVADEIKTLAGTELGKDAQANQWIMNGVGAISGSSLMDQRLLKNGLLNSKDFSRNLANRTQGTELVLQAYNTYNKDYDVIMEKINSGDLSAKTLQARAQVESMFDFANTDIFINPTDSEVNVSKKVLKDGVMVMSDNPDDFMNASELMQGATAQYANFKANDEAKALADSVGQRVLRDLGGNTVTEAYLKIDSLSVKEREKLDEARRLQIQAVLTDDKAGSFLVDTLNKTLDPGTGPYSFTKNKDEAARDEFKILMNQDGSNDFSTDNGKKQMKLAVEKFDVMLEGFLPASNKAALPKDPTSTDKSVYKNNKKEGSQISALASLQSGKTLEIREASAADIASRNKEISQIIETQEAFYTITTDKEGKSIVTSTPRPENTNLFVTGSAGRFTGVTDLETARKYSGITEEMTRYDLEAEDAKEPGKLLDTITLPDGQKIRGNVLFEQTTEPKKKGGLQKFNEQIDSDFSNIEIEGEQLITEADFEDDDAVIGKLTPLATKYGIRLVNPSNFSDSIKFLVGSGNNLIDQTIEFNDTTPEGLLKSLKGFIKSSKDAEERYLALDTEKSNNGELDD